MEKFGGLKEKEPDQRGLSKALQERYGISLVEQVRGLSADARYSELDFVLKKIETLLIEAGVEIDPVKRKDLKKYLRNTGIK